MSIRHYLFTIFTLLIILSLPSLSILKFNQAEAISGSAIFSGFKAALGLLPAIAAAPGQVLGMLKDVGRMMPNDSEQEIMSTNSEIANLQENSEEELTTSPTPDPEMANQVHELKQQLYNVQSELEILKQENPIEAENTEAQIGQAYKQELSMYSPQEQQLINQNFQYVAPEHLVNVAKQWAAFEKLWQPSCYPNCPNVPNIRVD